MHNQRVKIGVVIADLGSDDTKRALEYLILSMNTIQNSFDFQLVQTDKSNFITALSDGNKVSRNYIEESAQEFLNELKNKEEKKCTQYNLEYSKKINIVILSTAKFKDDYFQTGGDSWSLIALGNWKETMSPPSILEFFISMLIRTSIDKACQKNQPKRHFRSKGCCFDFCSKIEDARYFVLTGYLCDVCTKNIETETNKLLVTETKFLLSKTWLGTTLDPSNISLVTKKLGHDLFHTMGVQPKPWDRVKDLIFSEFCKQTTKLVFNSIPIIVNLILALVILSKCNA